MAEEAQDHQYKVLLNVSPDSGWWCTFWIFEFWILNFHNKQTEPDVCVDWWDMSERMNDVVRGHFFGGGG